VRGKWTNGNLGKEYAEGEWVSYQLKITRSSKLWGQPYFDIKYNFYQPSSDAIYVDGFDTSLAYGFQWSTEDLLPNGQDRPDTLWGTHIPTPEAGETAGATNIINFMDPLDPETQASPSKYRYFTVEGIPWHTVTGDHIVLFFRAHLALDAIWSARLEATLPRELDGNEFETWTAPHHGSSFATGSSRHFLLEIPGVGEKAVPIPIIYYSSEPWPEEGRATVAFEDLPMGAGNDYDYNDFVPGVSILGIYSDEGLVRLTFTFDAEARGASFHHDFNMLIPADTFGSGGAYLIEYFETDGSLISSTSSSFDNTADLDLVIFANTWEALPPNSGQPWSGNTYDGSGLQLGRRTIVTFEFTTPFAFDLTAYSPEYVGVHGDNLFFDPHLYVWDTGQVIHITDSRLIVVQTDWEWPEEEVGVWNVYPYNPATGEGVTAGDPPTFTTYWYTETPTDEKWTP